MNDTSETPEESPSTLKLVDDSLHALDLHLDQIFPSLFHSLTLEIKLEVIGHLLEMKEELGDGFLKSSEIKVLRKFFKMARMI